MPIGLVTGLGAALAWGTLDVLSAIAGRRIGSLRVTTGIQVIGAAFVIGLALAWGTTFPTDPRVLVGGALVGLTGAGAYLAYFTGLRMGPVAVVSGVVAAYGGLTVILAVIVRGESLTTAQAVGAALATLGVVLTGLQFDGDWRSTRLAGPGVAFAIVGLVLFASMSIVTDIVIDLADWLQVLLVSRSSNAIVTLVLLVIALTVARERARPVLADESGVEAGPATRDPRVLGLVAVAGMLDVVGLAVFTYGLEHAQTWLVGLASSFGPVVTIAAAVAFMGERLRRIQWVGVASIIAGMVAIAWR